MALMSSLTLHFMSEHLRHFLSFFKIYLFILFIYFIFGCIGSLLLCGLSLVAAIGGLLFIVVRGLLIAVASLVAEHGL